jgi:DNA repair protein RecO (recombination protein O)
MPCASSSTATAASGACRPDDRVGLTPVGLYRDRGVVLRTYRLGEADRIVVVLTRGHGKVRAVAKGVRKTKSRFGGRLEPASHVDLLMYEGRGELDIVSQAETVDHFRPLRDDLDRLARAVAVLEAADQLAMEGEANARLYDMVVGALRTLAGQDAPLVVPGFLLKALALEGFRPQVEACVACGSEGPLVSWALEEGGLRCAAHRLGPAVSPDAVAVLQAMLGGRLGAALAEHRPPVVSEVDHLAVRAFEHHVERRLRSVNALHRT